MEREEQTALARTMAINFSAVVRLMHGPYPALARNSGRVALIGSVADKGSAGMPVYSVSKGALAGLVRSLASEWADRMRPQAMMPARSTGCSWMRTGWPNF